MNKRIMVFSPEPRDLDEIALSIEDYVRKNFKNYLPIEIQKFSTIGEPSIRGYSIGNGGEVFLVFDRRICSDGSRNPSLRSGHEKEDFSQLALRMSKEHCDKFEIPYIQYDGEIAKRAEDMFIAKIEVVKDKIKGRLESIL
ncbi:Uncharacterised protein [uncultured archaeon]|nr:Uncharacterised protein [uncultured archaeon]